MSLTGLDMSHWTYDEACHWQGLIYPIGPMIRHVTERAWYIPLNLWWGMSLTGPDVSHWTYDEAYHWQGLIYPIAWWHGVSKTARHANFSNGFSSKFNMSWNMINFDNQTSGKFCIRQVLFALESTYSTGLQCWYPFFHANSQHLIWTFWCPQMKSMGTQSSNKLQRPGDCLNIKMPSYQYWDPHVKDKTVWQPSYL